MDHERASKTIRYCNGCSDPLWAARALRGREVACDPDSGGRCGLVRSGSGFTQGPQLTQEIA